MTTMNVAAKTTRVEAAVENFSKLKFKISIHFQAQENKTREKKIQKVGNHTVQTVHNQGGQKKKDGGGRRRGSKIRNMEDTLMETFLSIQAKRKQWRNEN